MLPSSGGGSRGFIGGTDGRGAWRRTDDEGRVDDWIPPRRYIV